MVFFSTLYPKLTLQILLNRSGQITADAEILWSVPRGCRDQVPVLPAQQHRSVLLHQRILIRVVPKQSLDHGVHVGAERVGLETRHAEP